MPSRPPGLRSRRHGTGLSRHVNIGVSQSVSQSGWHGELTVAAAAAVAVGSGGSDGAVGSALHVGPAEISLPVVTDSLWHVSVRHLKLPK